MSLSAASPSVESNAGHHTFEGQKIYHNIYRWFVSLCSTLLHPKWEETKDLVVDKMMKTPLGELRSFESEADDKTETGDYTGESHAASEGSYRSGPDETFTSNADVKRSEIADEAASLLSSLEKMLRSLIN